MLSNVTENILVYQNVGFSSEL